MGSSKYSNEQKSDCIYYGYIDYTKKLLKDIYEDYQNERFERSFATLDYSYRTPMVDCARRLIRSENDRFRRLRDKILKLVLSGDAVFITLTFKDEVLNKTSQATRRKYVARYLKENCPFYVANIDFGSDNDREHYHAVIGGRCDFSNWSYGFVYANEVRTHDNDAGRVARYVAKLTNHALKVKTVSSRLIYSRSVI